MSIARLFEDYGDVVYRRCAHLLRDDDLAMDAVQEVFVRAMAARNPFQGDSSPLTWLYRIATTYCLQQIRNRSRRRAKLELFSKSIPLQRSPDLESAISLERILNEQDDAVRQMAFFRFIDGMTLEEVAEVTGFSRKTVSKRLNAFVAVAKEDLCEGNEADDG